MAGSEGGIEPPGQAGTAFEEHPEPAPTDAPAAIVVDLDWRSVGVSMAALAALIVGAGLVRAAPRTATSLAIGGLLALALEPLVDTVDRRLPGLPRNGPGTSRRRGTAVAVVLGGFIATLGLLLGLLGPPAIRQARDLQDDVPEVVEDLGNLPVIGDDLRRNDVPERVEEWLTDLPGRLRGVPNPSKERPARSSAAPWRCSPSSW